MVLAVVQYIIIFSLPPVPVPYVERMNASLFYYKGFALRDPAAFPNLVRGH